MDKLKYLWEEFKRRPLLLSLFGAILCLGYLYVDLKKGQNKLEDSYKAQVIELRNKVQWQDNNIAFMTERLRRSDSIVNRLTERFETLKKLGKIE